MLFSVIPAKAGIQSIHNVMDPVTCPGHDPEFAGVTTKETFYNPIMSICFLFPEPLYLYPELCFVLSAVEP
jgi:hypothetical protein